MPISPAQEQSNTSEIVSQEATPSFRIQVERNLVQVRVVVRDSKGRVVSGLTKDDFRLMDNGKPQVISHFSEEVPSTTPPAEPPAEVPADEAGEEEHPAVLPDRYIALFFDDVHISFDDLARTRQAAERYLSTSVRPSDRVGVFTSSGEHQVDFTDDLGKIHTTLLALLPRPIVTPQDHQCPEISGYQAYMIVHRRDPYATEIAADEAESCHPMVTALVNNVPPEQIRAAALNIAESEAIRALTNFQLHTEYALRALDGLVRRMGGLPGQRSIVLVSPGFLMLTAEHRVSQLVERALRTRVVVNSLDAKGLFAHIPLGDATRAPVLPTRSAQLVGKKAQLDVDSLNFSADVMRTLAYDTGGTYFTNSNDLDEGFRRVGSLPEVYYLLAFSPQNMKFDGRFHKLKVTLTTKAKLSIQARNGYYAPEKPMDSAEQAKEEITQAIFSRDEVSELPIEIRTQFYKVNDTAAKLSILTRLDVKLVHFRKENGRNLNNLIFVTALFDRDGKYLAGKEKRVEFRLLDTSFEKLARDGITSKTSFDVPPGTYLVRQVVRDSEGAQLSALNRTVEIPL